MEASTTSYLTNLISITIPFLYREERLSLKNELQIRSKALLQNDFPSKEIIHEFKKKLDPPKALDLTWKQPNIVKFVASIQFHPLISIINIITLLIPEINGKTFGME